MSFGETVSHDVQVDASQDHEQSSPSVGITNFNPTVDQVRSGHQQARVRHRDETARKWREFENILGRWASQLAVFARIALRRAARGESDL